ncbi:hypothetical protein ACI2L4_26420 [Streptomyces sparsogenes]|uniref:hypothetical protein n=1 Tax=Streptomyces sparsogenes TaxID=67365 RepID=UPI0033E3B18C
MTGEDAPGAGVATWWGLIVEWHFSAIALDHIRGTREEALEALRERALHYRPKHPANPTRRLVYRDGDTFLLILETFGDNFRFRFRVAELLWDSAPRPGSAG